MPPVNSVTITASNGHGLAGANCTTRPLFRTLKVPGTGASATRTANDSGVMLAGSTGSVKVTVTRGGTASGVDVVKLARKGAASAWPARSVTVASIATAYTVLTLRAGAGVSVIVLSSPARSKVN